jgi:hypothetical protein
MSVPAQTAAAQRVGAATAAAEPQSIDAATPAAEPQSIDAATAAAEPQAPPPGATVPPKMENESMDLARIGWLATTGACLIAVVILLTQDYYGYAGVTFAVALSAAINLT